MNKTERLMSMKLNSAAKLREDMLDFSRGKLSLTEMLRLVRAEQFEFIGLKWSDRAGRDLPARGSKTWDVVQEYFSGVSSAVIYTFHV